MGRRVAEPRGGRRDGLVPRRRRSGGGAADYAGLGDVDRLLGVFPDPDDAPRPVFGVEPVIDQVPEHLGIEQLDDEPDAALSRTWGEWARVTVGVAVGAFLVGCFFTVVGFGVSHGAGTLGFGLGAVSLPLGFTVSAGLGGACAVVAAAVLRPRAVRTVDRLATRSGKGHGRPWPGAGGAPAVGAPGGPVAAVKR